MEDAVELGIAAREEVDDLVHISLDEKSYTKGHQYATILIDSFKDDVVEMVEGRKEKNVKCLFFNLNSQDIQPRLMRVNMC